MARNLYLNIGDDVSKAVSRIKRERGIELTLVFPKNSWLLSDPVNLKLLKKQTDMLGKYISIMTMDARGKEYAAQVGFEVKNIDYIKGAGRSLDVAQKPESVQLKKEMHASNRQEVRNLETLRAAAQSSRAKKSEPEENFFAEPLKKPEELPRQQLPQKALKISQPAIPKISRTFFKVGRRAWQSVAFIAVLVFILLVVFIFPSADITVYARTQPISRDLQVSVDKNALQPNSQQLIIPGVLIDEEEQANLQFNATGQTNIGNKARGPVQLYNFTRKTLKLNANTTVLTAGSKSYHFSQDISGIKPARYFGGTRDVDPASLIPPVEIIADQAGEDSNLPSGTRLEIHNDVLGTVPQLLYAASSASIDGGTSRLKTVVSQSDLNTAAKSLNSSMLAAAKQQLLNSKALMVLDSGANLQIKNTAFDKKLNDPTQTFNGTATGHLTALAFNPDVLNKLIEQRMNLTLDADKYLVTGSKEIIKQEFRNIDLFSGTGVLNVHFESIVASKIDTLGISDKINGKNAGQIKELLLSDPNIDAVDVNFSPFWVTSVPRFSGRVHVTSKLR